MNSTPTSQQDPERFSKKQKLKRVGFSGLAVQARQFLKC